jgi:hypothetical protein
MFKINRSKLEICPVNTESCYRREHGVGNCPVTVTALKHLSQHALIEFLTKEVAFRIEMSELPQLQVILNGLWVKGLITIYVALRPQICGQEILVQ